MNFPPPEWAREGAEQALRSTDGNHYAPAKGRLRLRKAIKEFYGTQFGKELDPETEIVVTSGANEGVYLVLWIVFLARSVASSAQCWRQSASLRRSLPSCKAHPKEDGEYDDPHT